MIFETITSSLLVKRRDDAIHGETVTTITVTDDGAGPFVTVKQYLDDAKEIEIAPEEWPQMRDAIDKMIAVCVELEKGEK